MHKTKLDMASINLTMLHEHTHTKWPRTAWWSCRGGSAMIVQWAWCKGMWSSGASPSSNSRSMHMQRQTQNIYACKDIAAASTDMHMLCLRWTADVYYIFLICDSHSRIHRQSPSQRHMDRQNDSHALSDDFSGSAQISGRQSSRQHAKGKACSHICQLLCQLCRVST